MVDTNQDHHKTYMHFFIKCHNHGASCPLKHSRLSLLKQNNQEYIFHYYSDRSLTLAAVKRRFRNTQSSHDLEFIPKPRTSYKINTKFIEDRSSSRTETLPRRGRPRRDESNSGSRDRSGSMGIRRRPSPPRSRRNRDDGSKEALERRVEFLEKAILNLTTQQEKQRERGDVIEERLGVFDERFEVFGEEIELYKAELRIHSRQMQYWREKIDQDRRETENLRRRVREREASLFQKREELRRMTNEDVRATSTISELRSYYSFDSKIEEMQSL